MHLAVLRSRAPRKSQILTPTNPQFVKNRRPQQSLFTDRALCPTNAPSVRQHERSFTKRGLRRRHHLT
jgi:hypothetical protein